MQRWRLKLATAVIYNCFFYRHNRKALVKTNTALLYDEKWNVLQWGAPALASKPKNKGGRDASKNNGKPVELFKIHLGSIDESKKPPLPLGLDYKRAITDYLRSMGTVRFPIFMIWSRTFLAAPRFLVSCFVSCFSAHWTNMQIIFLPFQANKRYVEPKMARFIIP